MKFFYDEFVLIPPELSYRTIADSKWAFNIAASGQFIIRMLEHVDTT